MHKNDLSTFTEKHIKRSQAFMNRRKEIAEPCVANNMSNSSLTGPVGGSDYIVSCSHLSQAHLAFAILVILKLLDYARISEQKLVNPSHLLRTPSLIL